MKEIFKQLISDFHEKGIPEVLLRKVQLPLHSKKIVSVIGPRRSGKTSLFFQTMTQIKDITDILYLNFENESFTINKNDFQKLVDAYFELYPHKKTFYLFLDEIQEIEGWEKFVRRIYDTVTQNIFITGSSSKLLSKEIATSLRGRSITYELYPLSFEEFTAFQNITPSLHSTRGRALLKNSFEKFMEIGGFPELLLNKPEFRKKTIQDYMHVMLLKDVIERHDIRNSHAVRAFFDKCIWQFAREYSVNKFYNELKSLGVKISKETLYDYIAYFEEAYIVLPLYNAGYSSEVHKLYLVDHSFSTFSLKKTSEDKGFLLENIVFVELKRKECDLFYDKRNCECDFIIRDGNKVTGTIQVCYTLDETNKKREINGLLEACKTYKLKKGLLLTFEQEEEFVQDGVTIIVKPVWKWLLE
ncbi:MAG: ATP-binding protein [Candidatus Woesearchaeota archaeon]